MAFVTAIAAHGYEYPAAYIKAHIAHCDSQRTVIKLTVWPTQADRENGAEPVRYDSDLRQFPTELQMQADNPIDYGHKLLEASGEFTDATWNV
jgi:hypothetical protein